MNDMSSVIIAKSDQQNSDDFYSGPRTILITEVKIAPGEQPVSIFFEGDDGKPWKPCKSMSRVLVAAWGPDAKAYVGRSLTLYRDAKVTWAGMEVGGIRISHMSDINGKMVMSLTATRGNKKPFVVQPLKAGATKPAATHRNFLAEIAASPDRSMLRAWWGANNEAIPDGDYEAVLAAFNARLNVVPKTAPAAPAPQEDESAAALASQPEGRDDSDMGEITTLADAKAEVDACEFVPDVDTRTAALLPLLGEEDADALRNYAMDKIAALGGGK